MSEIFDPAKLDKLLPPENLAAYEISKALEALPLNDEYDDFIDYQWQTRIQHLNIPRSRIKRDQQSKFLKNSHLFPLYIDMRDIKIASLQTQNADDWMLAINFWGNQEYYKCLVDSKSFTVSKPQDTKKPKHKNARLGNHLLYSILKGTGTRNLMSLDMAEKEMTQAEIAESFIDQVPEKSIYEKISTTGIIKCPNNFGLVAASSDKIAENYEICNASFDIAQRYDMTNAKDKKLLIYHYKTMVDEISDLKSSVVSWQLIDGTIDTMDTSMMLQPENEPQEISPMNNLEAWKNFMSIAEHVLTYAIRNT